MDEPFPAFFDVTVASPSHALHTSPVRDAWLSDLDLARSFSTPLAFESQATSAFDFTAANLFSSAFLDNDLSNQYHDAYSNARPACTSRWSTSSTSSESSVIPASELQLDDCDSSNATNSAISTLNAYGIPISGSDPSVQAWRCAYPRCSSRATFTRGCDLRKHYNRHSKHLYCRVAGCPRSQAVATAIAQSCNGPMSVGFSSEKDLERHEAQHNPTIKCEHRDRNGNKCGRVFSRVDNMKDHVKRIHKARR